MDKINHPAGMSDGDWDEAADQFYAEPLKRDRPTGVELIAAERKGQVTEEGWTPAHDDTHRHGELCGAAMCYIANRDVTTDLRPPFGWPWEPSWWKPSNDPVRNLVKAGALIAAEIDRLQRQQHRLDEDRDA